MVVEASKFCWRSPKCAYTAKTRYCGHHLPRLSRDVSQQDQTTCLFHHMGEGQMGAHSGGVPLSTIHWALLGTINMGYIHEIYWANTYNINRAKSAIYMEWNGQLQWDQMGQIQRAIKGNEWNMYRGQKCTIDKDIAVWLIDTQLNTMGIQWAYNGKYTK